MTKRSLRAVMAVSAIMVVGLTLSIVYVQRLRSSPFRPSYRGYLSDRQFRWAVIGKWTSAWAVPGRQNIEYLELSWLGRAKVVIDDSGKKSVYAGPYHIIYTRPPHPSSVTIADVVIEGRTAPNGGLRLPGVHFDMTNVIGSGRMFLRTRREPFGTLTRES